MKKEELFIVLILIVIIATLPIVIKELFFNFRKDNESYTFEYGIETSENANRKVGDEYFNDALFIGDSRTVGIRDYGEIENATFFADIGLDTDNLRTQIMEVKNFGEMTLDELLSKNKFKKIYVMLGLNNMYGDIRFNISQYAELIEYISGKQKNAIIYIQSNLHINEKKFRKEGFENIRIDTFNNGIAKLANGKNILYLDVNEYFDQGDGNLREDYTLDGVHLCTEYYKEWVDWIKQHAKEEL